MAREDRYERLRVTRYSGLDLNTAKVHMDEGAGRVTENFDFRRIGSARLRPGFARLYTTAQGELQVATDLFTRADGALGSDWTGRGATTILIVVNTVRIGVTTNFAYAGAEWAGAGTFAADQYAKVTVSQMGVLSKIGPMVRSSASGAYAVTFDGTTFDLRIVRITSWATGVCVDLDSVVYSPVVGDVITLKVIGNSIAAYVNGVLKVSSTDDVLTSGKPGIYAVNMGGILTRGRVDDFYGGSIVSFATAVKSQDTPSRLFAFERDDEETRLVIADGSRMEQFGETLPEWGT